MMVPNADDKSLKQFFRKLLLFALLMPWMAGCDDVAEPEINVISDWQKTDMPDSMHVWALAATSGGTLFAGAYSNENVFRSGIYRSEDNGLTWTLLSKSPSNTIILCLTTNYLGNIFAGTYNQGVYRSTDNGDNWTKVNFSPTYTSVWSIASNEGGELFAGTDHGGVFYSNNLGSTWQQTNLRARTIASLLTFGANHVLAADAVILHSTDNFASWTRIDTGLAETEYWYITSLAMNSGSTLFATKGSRVWRSSDQGVHWAKSDSLSASMTSLAVTSNGHIFAGTTANGMYRSTDGGVEWNAFNNGLDFTDNIIRSLAVAGNGSVIVGTEYGIYRGIK